MFPICFQATCHSRKQNSQLFFLMYFYVENLFIILSDNSWLRNKSINMKIVVFSSESVKVTLQVNGREGREKKGRGERERK